MESLNESIFFWLHDFAGRIVWLDWTINFLASDLILILSFVLAVFFVAHRNKHKGFEEFGVVFSSGAIAVIIAGILKFLFNTPRPFTVFVESVPLFYTGLGAFPSGHTAFFMALGVSFHTYHKSLAYFFIISALVIGTSRVIAGVHFPLDIVGGALLGAFVGFLVPLLYNRFK